MCRSLIIVMLNITTVSFIQIHGYDHKFKDNRQMAGNEIIEKSDSVVLKFPLYTMRIPPMITPRIANPNADIDPNPVNCNSASVTKAVQSLGKKMRCKPRDTVIEVKSPRYSLVNPNVIIVKKCGGICVLGRNCVPTQQKSLDVYVTTTSLQSKMAIACNRIEIQEDVKCKCQRITESCTPSQKYNTNSLKCECPRSDEYDKCTNRNDAEFDNNTCKCQCINKIRCTTGTFWSDKHCRCLLLHN